MLLRLRRSLLRLQELSRGGADARLALQAQVPSAFPAPAGIVTAGQEALLFEHPPRGRRLDRAGLGGGAGAALALLAWQLSAAGHPPRELEPALVMRDAGRLCLLDLPTAGSAGQAAQSLVLLQARLAGRRPTAALRAPQLAEVVWRATGGAGGGAANALLRAALAPLPDATGIEQWCRQALQNAQDGGLPPVLVAPDLESADALCALLCRAALRLGLTLLPEGIDAAGAVRLKRLTGLPAAEAWLARPRGQAVVVLAADWREAATLLVHAARIPAWPPAGRAALVAWLRPLHAPPELLSELLLPLLEADAPGARRLVLALIERTGAAFTEGAVRIQPHWPDELRAMVQARRVNLVHPSATRLAMLLSLAPGGLSLAAVDGTPELQRAADLLVATGLAQRAPDILLPAPSLYPPQIEPAARRTACLWLAGREHFCPSPDPLRRAAWCAGLRLRGGEINAWQDSGCERLFAELCQGRHFAEALELCESHALCAARLGEGPPAVAVLLAARELASALWTPRRARRMLRLWTRGYSGPWLALLLGLRATVERQLHGFEAWLPLVERVRALAPGLPRLQREQALIAAALACCYEDPGTALDLLAGVGPEPAQSARLASLARVLYIRAECAFVGIRLSEALDLLQQARQALHPRAYAPLLARWEGHLEAMQVNAQGVASFFERGVEESMQPLRALQQRHGCLQDLVARALVNQYLFRLRLREIGSLDATDVEAVLAEARPDHVRGYLIVLYQLSENAIYRGDAALVQQLGARMQALDAARTSPMAWAGWVRHNALRLALAGDFARARAWWRQSSVRRLPEPWRTRMGHLRIGERGVLRLLAGRPQAARRDLREASRRLQEMSAGGRASGLFCLAVVLELLAGAAPRPDELADLESMGRRGYHLPGLVALLASCAASGEWQSLQDIADHDEAPALWRCLVLGAGAMLARAGALRQAAQLAQAALALVPPHVPLLRAWLEREFPLAEHRPGRLDPETLQALADLHIDPLRPAEPAVLLRQACDALRQATGCESAGLLAAPVPGFVGAPALRPACETALAQGESLDSAASAVSLQGAAGALAVAQGQACLPTLQAVAARLDELLAVSAARQERDMQRRRARLLAAAGWALGSEESLGARLNALSALAAAESGAAGVELALLRRGSPVLATSRIPEFETEFTSRVDDALSLRLRAGGGEREVLERACQSSARALAAALRRGPDSLRGELGRAVQGEVVWAAGEPLGTSPASARLADSLRRFSDLDLTVVISGAPGSGKDLAARALHQSGPRADRPHVVVDCATLRAETAASELFGHVRGAFTGALADHAGLLETAGSGTLQLDNPGELAQPVQAMLLRALQQRRFLPVGGSQERELRARLVVTSAEPLEELAGRGRLRPDLAQRLAGLNLRVPSLSDRGDDAVFLARHFVREAGRQFGRVVRLSAQSEQWLSGQAWPGNVRQLRSMVARAAVLCQGGVITPDDLRSEPADGAAGSLRLPRDVPGLAMSGRLVLAGLRELGDASCQDLVRRLGLSRTSVSTALSDLARRGLAERQGMGRGTRYLLRG